MTNKPIKPTIPGALYRDLPAEPVVKFEKVEGGSHTHNGKGLQPSHFVVKDFELSNWSLWPHQEGITCEYDRNLNVVRIRREPQGIDMEQLLKREPNPQLSRRVEIGYRWKVQWPSANREARKREAWAKLVVWEEAKPGRKARLEELPIGRFMAHLAEGNRIVVCGPGQPMWVAEHAIEHCGSDWPCDMPAGYRQVISVTHDGVRTSREKIEVVRD